MHNTHALSRARTITSTFANTTSEQHGKLSDVVGPSALGTQRSQNSLRRQISGRVLHGHGWHVIPTHTYTCLHNTHATCWLSTCLRSRRMSQFPYRRGACHQVNHVGPARPPRVETCRHFGPDLQMSTGKQRHHHSHNCIPVLHWSLRRYVRMHASMFCL